MKKYQPMFLDFSLLENCVRYLGGPVSLGHFSRSRDGVCEDFAVVWNPRTTDAFWSLEESSFSVYLFQVWTMYLIKSLQCWMKIWSWMKLVWNCHTNARRNQSFYHVSQRTGVDVSVMDAAVFSISIFPVRRTVQVFAKPASSSSIYDRTKDKRSGSNQDQTHQEK